MCGALLSHFPCYFLSQSLTESGPLKLARLAWQGESVSCYHPVLGYVFVPLHLSSVCACWRVKLMLPYLHNKYFTNWATFPILIFFLFMDDYFFISCHILFIHWPISEQVNYMSWLLWLCSNDQVNTDNTLWYWFLVFFIIYVCILTS